MASNVNMKYSLEELWAMTCPKLRQILKDNKKIVKGNKQMLVTRCYALQSAADTKNDRDDNNDSSESDGENTDFDPLAGLKSMKEIRYSDLLKTAKGRQWDTDLRKLPKTNFHQLFQYLVVRTKKYGDGVMKGECYKKLRAFKFFVEGHIKSYEIAKAFGKIWVKSKVIASMKHEMYGVMLICDDNSDILYAACECPAG